MMLSVLYVGLQACNAPTGITETTNLVKTTAATSQLFADGVKGVKIFTTVAVGGSFTAPASLPVSSAIPSGYPGYDGSTTYLPGVKATQYFSVDGGTLISKPSWLVDVQLGVTTTTNSGCAAFGGAGGFDAQNFYRVSEPDCGAAVTGTGGGTDPIFARIVLNRDQSVIGSAENLMVQIEYQASGLHLNSDGVSVSPEDNLDQLWKVFWNSTLGVSDLPKPFSIFVPPNYAACLDSGTGAAGSPGNCAGSYKGSPIKTKQMIIPLSAYSTMKVIQFSRVKGRINQGGNYVSSFAQVIHHCVWA